MMKMTVLYTPPTDLDAFESHYLSVHLPLAGKIPGLVRAETSRVPSAADGSPGAFHRIAELYFDDAAALGAGMGSPEGAAAGADATDLAQRTGSTVQFVASELD